MTVFFVALAAAAAFAGVGWNAALTNSKAGLRGIHDAGQGVIWASGTDGTVLRSEDAGYMWQNCTLPADAAKLDFRAVYAWDANRAAVMSSGSGSASRLYETKDGGASWRMAFEDPDADGFWDALTFFGTSGFILGDPVNGQFVLYTSRDTGEHWQRDPAVELAASHGEGAFAASNSSLAVLPNSEILFGTGGIGGPHVFRRDKSGAWSVRAVPMAGRKESAGIFSIAFRDDLHGVAVGGDYKEPSQTTGTAAWTSDGGMTWHAPATLPSGYRSSVGWDRKLQEWIAVGPTGSDLSRDDGRTWMHFDSGDWNALSLPWVSGPGGRIASLE